MRRLVSGLCALLVVTCVTWAWASESQTIVQFSWDPLPGATRYEIQVARNRSFTQDVRTEIVEGTTWKTELSTLTYYWRVRGIDADGIPGVFSPARQVEEKQRVRPTPRPTPLAATPTPVVQATPAPTPVAVATPGESTHVDFRDRIAGGTAGLRVGAYSNLARVTVGRLDLEVGRHIVPESPWILAARVGYFSADQRFGDGTVTAQSELYAFPVQATGRYLRTTPFLDLYGGGGVMLTYLRATVDISTQPTYRQSSTEVGALLFGGVERRIGPGHLSLEIDYSFSTNMTGFVEMDPGGIALSLGYRFEVGEL